MESFLESHYLHQNYPTFREKIPKFDFSAEAKPFFVDLKGCSAWAKNAIKGGGLSKKLMDRNRKSYLKATNCRKNSHQTNPHTHDVAAWKPNVLGSLLQSMISWMGMVSTRILNKRLYGPARIPLLRDSSLSLFREKARRLESLFTPSKHLCNFFTK